MEELMVKKEQGKGTFLDNIISYLPASVHVIEINERLETKLYWSSGNYEKYTGVTVDQRKAMGFLHPRDIYHPDDVEPILALTEYLYANPGAEASLFCRFCIHNQSQWVYVKLRRISVVSGKRHALSLFFPLGNAHGVNHLQFDTYLKEKACHKNKSKLEVLTPSELQVFRLLGTGLSTKEAADALCRSRETVNNHRRAIFKKLDIHKIGELVALVKECGLDRSSQPDNQFVYEKAKRTEKSMPYMGSVIDKSYQLNTG
ncbi:MULTISPECIES: helix-turn-helix transcriptional regulator [unclassified Carboxylicivirga]|uniref:helix-turn-helix transcriptional regulator n=1 Tax=Carboxylicivirga TaxID=1628153 RepID=UPI003D34DE68